MKSLLRNEDEITLCLLSALSPVEMLSDACRGSWRVQRPWGRRFLQSQSPAVPPHRCSPIRLNYDILYVDLSAESGLIARSISQLRHCLFWRLCYKWSFPEFLALPGDAKWANLSLTSPLTFYSGFLCLIISLGSRHIYAVFPREARRVLCFLCGSVFGGSNVLLTA